MTPSRDNVLHGWKDIAAYVSRDVSTVKRWEKQRGLPVRRVPGGGRANVYAHITELAQWLASADSDSVDVQAATASFISEYPMASADSVASLQSEARGRPPVWFTGVAVACSLAAMFVGITHYVSSRSRSSAEAALTLPHTSTVPGAEDLYLRGVYSYERRTSDSLRQAESYLQAATAKDSRYAPAYAGLAVTYNLMREYGSMPSAEAYAKSRSAAQKAISLDPKLSEAHAALGFVEFFRDWKATAAESEFRTAIALDPRSALARHWYGSMLTHEGRFAEAIEQLKVAQRLAPDSTSILLARALALGFGGHRQEAIDLLHQISEQDPEFRSVHLRLRTISMVEPSDLNMYFTETEAWATLNHDPVALASCRELQRTFTANGEAAMWRTLLRDLQGPHPSQGPTGRAAAEAELGNKDAAFAILRGLAEHHTDEVLGINLKPELQSLHADPRYNQVLAKMGLPALRPS